MSSVQKCRVWLNLIKKTIFRTPYGILVFSNDRSSIIRGTHLHRYNNNNKSRNRLAVSPTVRKFHVDCVRDKHSVEVFNEHLRTRFNWFFFFIRHINHWKRVWTKPFWWHTFLAGLTVRLTYLFLNLTSSRAKRRICWFLFAMCLFFSRLFSKRKLDVE